MTLDCAALYGALEAYLAALGRKDPGAVNWSPDPFITENNVRLAADDGLWGTIERLGDYRLMFADVATRQVGYFGTVIEPMDESAYTVRLGLDAAGRVAEVETIVVRQVDSSPRFENQRFYDKPILKAEWLQPGQHVTAMGSDAEHKNEIDPAAIVQATPYVADSLKQTRRLGELHHALAAGLVSETAGFPELGAIVAGQTEGRRSRDAITLCDLTGTGVQDTAIATLAHRRAILAGAGQAIETTKASGDPA